MLHIIYISSISPAKGGQAQGGVDHPAGPARRYILYIYILYYYVSYYVREKVKKESREAMGGTGGSPPKYS